MHDEDSMSTKEEETGCHLFTFDNLKRTPSGSFVEVVSFVLS